MGEVFSDTVDCAQGESPMTDFQFKQNLAVIFQIVKGNCEAGKSQTEILEIIASLRTGADLVAKVYQVIKAYFEAGKSPEEVLDIIAALAKEWVP